MQQRGDFYRVNSRQARKAMQYAGQLRVFLEDNSVTIDGQISTRNVKVSELLDYHKKLQNNNNQNKFLAMLKTLTKKAKKLKYYS